MENGDPVAHITRVIRNADCRIVYFAKVTYRADLLELDMEFDR